MESDERVGSLAQPAINNASKEQQVSSDFICGVTLFSALLIGTSKKPNECASVRTQLTSYSAEIYARNSDGGAQKRNQNQKRKCVKTKSSALALTFLLLAAKCYGGPGAFDPTFNATPSGPVYAIAIQPNNRAIVAGAFTTINNISRGHVARLFPDGSLDFSFLTNNLLGASSTVWTMALQPDGRILIGGDFTTVNSQSRSHVARLNTDGSLDGTFIPTNAITSTVNALALQSDGKVLIGGTFIMIYFS